MKQSQKNCLIGPPYHPCERQEGTMRPHFVRLFAGNAMGFFCFLTSIATIMRSSSDFPMTFVEMKCGCTHSDIVSINV